MKSLQCPHCDKAFSRRELMDNTGNSCPNCGCTDPPISLPDVKYMRCTLCRAEMTVDELEVGGSKCPKCGTRGVPCFIEDDVEIKINTHELRVLSIWAHNAASRADEDHKDDPHHESMRAVLRAILKPIHDQLKEKGMDVPLTMEEELTQLRDSKLVTDATMFRDGKEVVTLEEEEAAGQAAEEAGQDGEKS